MNKQQKKIIFYLEFFYRNFGNNWKITDFPEEIIDNIDKIYSIFLELETKGIIKFSEDKSYFTILKLPSEYYDINED